MFGRLRNFRDRSVTPAGGCLTPGKPPLIRSAQPRRPRRVSHSRQSSDALERVSDTGLWAAPRAQPWIETISGMIRMATMLAILIIGLMAGPAVSLYGSPTVSPVTEAAWASEPFPP